MNFAKEREIFRIFYERNAQNARFSARKKLILHLDGNPSFERIKTRVFFAKNKNRKNKLLQCNLLSVFPSVFYEWKIYDYRFNKLVYQGPYNLGD